MWKEAKQQSRNNTRQSLLFPEFSIMHHSRDGASLTAVLKGFFMPYTIYQIKLSRRCLKTCLGKIKDALPLPKSHTYSSSFLLFQNSVHVPIKCGMVCILGSSLKWKPPYRKECSWLHLTFLYNLYSIITSRLERHADGCVLLVWCDPSVH